MLLLQSQRPEGVVPDIAATQNRLLLHASPQPPQLSVSPARFLQAIALDCVLQHTAAGRVALQVFRRHFESAQSIAPLQSLSTPSLQLSSQVHGAA